MHVRNVFSGRPDSKLNGINGIKLLSEERQYRIMFGVCSCKKFYHLSYSVDLAHHPGVLDAIFFCLSQGEGELNQRCQLYAIKALNGLLLEVRQLFVLFYVTP